MPNCDWGRDCNCSECSRDRTRDCSICGKPQTEYYIIGHKPGRGGYSSHCLPCEESNSGPIYVSVMCISALIPTGKTSHDIINRRQVNNIAEYYKLVSDVVSASALDKRRCMNRIGISYTYSTTYKYSITAEEAMHNLKGQTQ